MVRGGARVGRGRRRLPDRGREGVSQPVGLKGTRGVLRAWVVDLGAPRAGQNRHRWFPPRWGEMGLAVG